MTTRTEDRLTTLGSEHAPGARPEFVAELEDRLRRLPSVDTVGDRRLPRTRWVAAGVAAALLALLGAGLFNIGHESEVRTLSPAASSTVQDEIGGGSGEKATDDGGHDPATPPAKEEPQRTPPSSQQPADEESAEPGPLKARAIQHHGRVMLFWERYDKPDFAFYEVRRADEHRPGYSVVTRIRDHEESGTADEVRDPHATVRYQIVVVSRDGSEVATSGWITPEERPEKEASEPSPIATIP